MKWPLILLALGMLGGVLAILAGVIWKHKEEVLIGVVVIVLMLFTFLVGRVTRVW